MDEYPVSSVLYFSKNRPKHSVIVLLSKYFQFIISIVLSILLCILVIPYEKPLTIIVLIIYLSYVVFKQFIKKKKKLSEYYNREFFGFLRSLFLIFALTLYIFLLKITINNYDEIHSFDSLWLLYIFAIFITSQRGNTKYLFLSLFASSIGLLLITAPNGTSLISTSVTILNNIFNTQYISRIIWITLISFLLHIVSRLLSDYAADLNAIYELQNELQEIEYQTIDSPEAQFQENQYYQNVADKIAAEYNYPHVLIFIIDDSGKIRLIAGSSEECKSLIDNNFILEQEKSIVKHVITTGQPYSTNNAPSDNIFYAHPSFLGTKSEMAVPIFDKKRVIGCIDIQSNVSRLFLQQDIYLIKIIANYLSYSIHNTKIHSRRETLNELIKTIATRVFTKQELFGTFEEITKIAHEQLGADVSILYGRDQETKIIYGPVCLGKILNSDFSSTYIDKECVISKLFSANEKIILNQNAQEISNNKYLSPSHHHIRYNKKTFIEREEIKANIIIRLLSDGVCVGLLFINYRTEQEFSAWDMEIITSLATLGEIAIQKEQTYRRLLQSERENHAIEIHDPLVSNIWGIENILQVLAKYEIHEQEYNDLVRLGIQSVNKLKKDVVWLQGTYNDNYSGNFYDEANEIISRARKNIWYRNYT